MTRAEWPAAGANLPTLQWYGLEGDPSWVSSLDPGTATDTLSDGIIEMINAGLVKLDTDGRVIPDLAYRWVIARNHKTYWFYLRSNARFSNGDPVTAHDVVFSLTRALAKSTASPIATTYLGHILGAKRLYAGKTNSLQGVKALGRSIVQISLDQPIAYFMKTISYPTDMVLDPRIVAGKKPQTFLTNSCTGNVGAGPFMFLCLNSSTDKTSFYAAGHSPTMTMVPNPYYYGRKARIRIVTTGIATTQVGYLAYRANQLDVTNLPTADIKQWKGSSQLRANPTASIQNIVPNTQMAPFTNVHCRLAVAYAIDRATITRDVLHGAYAPNYAMVPRGFLGWYAGKTSPHFDPTKAKAELAQCPGGIHNIALPYPRLSSDFDNEMAAVGSMLSNVGVDLRPKGLPTNDWLNLVIQPLSRTHTPIVVGTWSADYPDPEDFCTLMGRAGAAYDIGSYNNPTYNILVDRADTTFNPTQRARLYVQAQRLNISQGAFITLWGAKGFGLVKPWVHGLVGSEFLWPGINPVGNDWSNVWVSKH